MFTNDECKSAHSLLIGSEQRIPKVLVKAFRKYVRHVLNEKGTMRKKRS
jgi:hypothetical protein